jgi:hypothetical protein
VADFINGFYCRFPELESANPTLWGTTISSFSSTIATTLAAKKKEEEDATKKAEAEKRKALDEEAANLAALAKLQEEKGRLLMTKGLIAAQDALKHDELVNGRYEQATKLLADATDDIRESELFNVLFATTFADDKKPQERKPNYFFCDVTNYIVPENMTMDFDYVMVDVKSARTKKMLVPISIKCRLDQLAQLQMVFTADGFFSDAPFVIGSTVHSLNLESLDSGGSLEGDEEYVHPHHKEPLRGLVSQYIITFYPSLPALTKAQNLVHLKPLAQEQNGYDAKYCDMSRWIMKGAKGYFDPWTFKPALSHENGGLYGEKYPAWLGILWYFLSRMPQSQTEVIVACTGTNYFDVLKATSLLDYKLWVYDDCFSKFGVQPRGATPSKVNREEEKPSELEKLVPVVERYKTSWDRTSLSAQLLQNEPLRRHLFGGMPTPARVFLHTYFLETIHTNDCIDIATLLHSQVTSPNRFKEDKELFPLEKSASGVVKDHVHEYRYRRVDDHGSYAQYAREFGLLQAQKWDYAAPQSFLVNTHICVLKSVCS